MDKQQLKEREARVIELATAFCKEHLDDECAELCTKLVQKLGVQNLCRNWDASVPVHYSLEGLRYGQLLLYIPSAASTSCSAKVLG